MYDLRWLVFPPKDNLDSAYILLSTNETDTGTNGRGTGYRPTRMHSLRLPRSFFYTAEYISVVSTQKSLLTTWKFISVWEYILARRLTNRATGLDRISQSYEIDFDAKSKLQDLHFVDTSLNIRRILFYMCMYKYSCISESNRYKLHFSDFMEERVEKYFNIANYQRCRIFFHINRIFHINIRINLFLWSFIYFSLYISFII